MDSIINISVGVNININININQNDIDKKDINKKDINKKDIDKMDIDKMEITIDKYNDKKYNNTRIADIFSLNNNINKSMRLYQCSTYLKFAQNKIDKDNIKLIQSNSCRVRLCPICTWRRSLKIFRNNKIMFEDKKVDKLQYIFLTLTAKNCKADNLSKSIDNMLSAFNKMTKLVKIKNAWVGYIRNLEVTYNDKMNTYHPHIHVLIGVKSTYFVRNYITQKEYAEMFKKYMKIDYTPVVDIRKIKKIDYKSIAEISKYMTKYSDILKLDDIQLSKVVATLDNALNARRLIAYGFLFKELQKELKLSDKKLDDIINVENILENISDEWEIYIYRYYLDNYNLVSE